jgi:hypothetical protein
MKKNIFLLGAILLFGFLATEARADQATKVCGQFNFAPVSPPTCQPTGDNMAMTMGMAETHDDGTTCIYGSPFNQATGTFTLNAMVHNPYCDPTGLVQFQSQETVVCHDSQNSTAVVQVTGEGDGGLLKGRWTIVSGTGIYATAHGGGSFDLSIQNSQVIYEGIVINATKCTP